MSKKPAHKHEEPTTYQAFIVRLWQDGADALWRGSVQSVQTGEIVRFVSLTELFAFLESQTNEESEEDIL